MSELRELASFEPARVSGLDWKQTSIWERSYELECGGAVLARIEFQNLLGTKADARTAKSHWTFKRTGIFTPVVTARPAESEEVVARYEPNWSGSKGSITLANGEEGQLRSVSFWGGDWGLFLGGEQPAIRFETHGLTGSAARVQLDELVRRRGDLELLLTFGFYVLVLHRMDAAAVVAAG